MGRTGLVSSCSGKLNPNQEIRENLVAERIAIDSYREMVDYVKDTDPTTHKLLREILETEEEHAEDLVSLLNGLSD